MSPRPLSSETAPPPAWQVFPEDKNQLYISVTASDPIKQRAVKIDSPKPIVIPVTVKRSALEVYQEVHISIIRLQKFVRGYLVRV